MQRSRPVVAAAPSSAWPARRGHDGGGSFYAARGKRLFDLAVAAAALLAAAPVLLLVAAAVRVVDGGPVLFRHARLGRDLRPFRMLKFRTMQPDAARFGPITKAGDPRVTPLGAVLRRHKLDELPQLWNVVTGEMSLVGPRPDVPGYLDLLDERRFAAVRRLRPGITGPATLALAHEERLLAEVKDPTRFNDEVLFPLKSELNLRYAGEVTFRGDLAVLWDTLFRRGARALDLPAVRALAQAHGIEETPP